MDSKALIDRLERFIENTSYNHVVFENCRRGLKSVVFNFPDITLYDVEVAEALVEDPENTLQALTYAIERVCEKRLTPRIKNLPGECQVSINEVRSEHLRKMIEVKAIIRQKSKVLPKTRIIRFECPSCATVIPVLQNEETIREPRVCTCGRKGKFYILGKEFEDYQVMVLEEDPEGLGSRQPQRINVILKNDLVTPFIDSKTNPGSKLAVSGLVAEKLKITKMGVSTTSDFVLNASSLQHLEEELFDKTITRVDEEKFQDFAKTHGIKVIDELVKFIAPSVYGNEEAKEAMLLQAVSGVAKVKKDGTTRRGNIHLLFVGDPSCAKSVLGRSLLPLVKKSRYVSGKGSSAAGLTASVIRNEITGSYAVEAGAMVLASGSVLVADELEKMSPEDRSNLHTGMEQGIVSVSKANIQCTLKAETSILGIANPEFGRFDEYQSVAQQINLPYSLLSRFDLIFVFKDRPDEVRDEALADFILSEDSSVSSDLDFDFFRKYLSYAKNLSPKTSPEAVNELKRFYVNLRKKNKEKNSVAIAARQLEALERLASACAKLRLSKKVLKSDADRAVRLMHYCFSRIAVDEETGSFDVDRIETGVSSSLRHSMVKVKELVLQLEKATGNKLISLNDLAREAEVVGVGEERLEECLEKLKNEFYTPRPGFIQRM